MAINDNTAKAVETVNSYVIRYYGRLRGDVASTSLVGSPAAVAERIEAFLSRGLDTLSSAWQILTRNSWISLARKFCRTSSPRRR